MIGYSGVYLAGRTSQTSNEFSYLEDEKNIKSLADDMSKISDKAQLARSPASDKNLLSVSNYSDFLNPSNPYHVLLSFKIANQGNESVDKKMKTYEMQKNLDYHKELRSILISGNFINHQKEEDFIIGQLSTTEHNEVISALHDKLIINLQSLNPTDGQGVNYFKRLLEIYIDKIHQSELNELDLRSQLATEIRTPFVLNIFNEAWEFSPKKIDENPALDFSDEQDESQINETANRIDEKPDLEFKDER